MAHCALHCNLYDTMSLAVSCAIFCGGGVSGVLCIGMRCWAAVLPAAARNAHVLQLTQHGYTHTHKFSIRLYTHTMINIIQNLCARAYLRFSNVKCVRERLRGNYFAIVHHALSWCAFVYAVLLWWCKRLLYGVLP